MKQRRTKGEITEDSENDTPLDPDLPQGQMSPRQADQLRILATEMLRRMRGVQGKLPNQVLKRWGQVRPADPTDWLPLEGGENLLTFDFPLTTSEVLWRSAKGNSAQCFVNWNDANRRGMRPARLVLPYRADIDRIIVGRGVTAAYVASTCGGTISIGGLAAAPRMIDCQCSCKLKSSVTNANDSSLQMNRIMSDADYHHVPIRVRSRK